MVPQEPENHRSAPTALLARAEQQDFAPALEQFLGSSAGQAASATHEADRGVTGEVCVLVREGPVQRVLRLRVGGRLHFGVRLNYFPLKNPRGGG